MALDDFITVQDVARRLGLTPSRVYQLIRENIIKADKVGEEKTVLLVSKAELSRYIQTVGSKNDAPLAGTSR